MSETAQVVIISIITVLTIILSLVGIQLYLLIKEVRKSLHEATSVIDDISHITKKLSHSTESVTGMFDGMRAVLSIIGAIKKVQKKYEK